MAEELFASAILYSLNACSGVMPPGRVEEGGENWATGVSEEEESPDENIGSPEDSSLMAFTARSSPEEEAQRFRLSAMSIVAFGSGSRPDCPNCVDDVIGMKDDTDMG
jgi:hypothetical protein